MKDEYEHIIPYLEQGLSEARDRLRTFQSCDALEAEAGWLLHDLYREEYPFKSDTKFIAASGWNKEYEVVVPDDRHINYSTVQFERWVYGDKSKPPQIIFLAWSPEENTIYWYRGNDERAE